MFFTTDYRFLDPIFMKNLRAMMRGKAKTEATEERIVTFHQQGP